MLPLRSPLALALLAIAATGSTFVANSVPRAEALTLSSHGGLTRRDVLVGAGAAAVGVGAPFPSWAAGGNDAAPIAVIGASGRTGALCVASCLRRGIPVRALTRSGGWPPAKIDLSAVGFDGDATAANPLLTVGTCDVRSVESLRLGGCRAAIYAASSSKAGGNSKEVDGDGVIATGNACLRDKVARYVVLSSTATTRPASLGFKFTEMAVPGIMTNKRLGEVGVAAAFADSKASSYTIVRPGGLDEPKQNIIQGPAALEITQGDVLAGYVSRADVAEVAVELALSTAPNMKNTALELYYRNKVMPVDKKYRRYALDPDNGVVERLHADSYEELFKGVVQNYDYLVDA